MPTFHYQSVTTTGQSTTGTIDAIDRSEAIRLLRQRGELATRVEPLNEAMIVLPGGGGSGGGNGVAAAASVGGGSIDAEVGRSRTARAMTKQELASFIRELATALEAGLPLMNSLRAVARQASSARQEATVKFLIARIEDGRSFAQAAAEWGAPFDDMTVGMIRAGEASGKLEIVLLQLADLLDRDAEVRRSVRGALVYPAILIVVLSLGVAIIVGIIIPRILETIEGQVSALPLPTRVVKGFADFIATWWVFLIGVIICAVVGWRAAMRQPEFKLRVHRTMLRIPVVGEVLRNVAVARFARTLGTLMSSGLPVMEALVVTRDTLGNKAMENVIDEVTEKVRGGKSIADPMERSGYFPPLLIQIISLGERSGRLDEMLSQAAHSLDRKTEASIKLFMTLLPPAIVLSMAVVVVFVLAAVLLPLVEMQSSIG
ncbi:MAG: type II secretion system F family protein [Phycisphaerales bacterium]